MSIALRKGDVRLRNVSLNLSAISQNKVSLRFGANSMAFQVSAGSTVYRAPLSIMNFAIARFPVGPDTVPSM